MIRVRLFDPRFDDIQRFLREHGEIDTQRDHIFIAECASAIVGILVVRLVPFAHTLELDSSPIARRVADALIQYGRGYTRASGFSEVMFVVDPENVRMSAFLTTQDAAKDSNVDVYILAVK